MSLRRILALARRIVAQFVRDHRSLALLFLAPLLVMTILNFVLPSSSGSVALGIVPPPGPAGEALVGQLRERVLSQPGLTLRALTPSQVDSALTDHSVDGVLVFPQEALGPGGTAPALTLRLEGSDPAAARRVVQVVTLLASTLEASTGGVPAPPLHVSYLYGGPQYTQTDALAPLFVGLFSFFFIYLLASVAFLRERSQGTLERLLASPLRRGELVLGYVLGFMLFALAQSLVILLFVIGVLRVHYAGNPALLFLVTLVLTVASVHLGIFASAFARTELQVIQFVPLLFLPQMLLGGFFFPVETLPVVLRQLAAVLPLTYANSALKDVMLRGLGLAAIWPSLAFLVGFAALMIVAAALSLRQERL